MRLADAGTRAGPRARDDLSLGVTEQKLQQLPKRQQLQHVIEEGYFKDVLIVAAAHNDHPFTRSYPALFAPPLLSVDKRLFENSLDFAYEQRDQIEFLVVITQLLRNEAQAVLRQKVERTDARAAAELAREIFARTFQF